MSRHYADIWLCSVYKPGKVAIVLNGRQAGKKVVVIKQLDEGTKDRQYPYALVAGIERYPLKVTRKMSDKKIKRRSRLKPFIKVRTFKVLRQIVQRLACHWTISSMDSYYNYPHFARGYPLLLSEWLMLTPHPCPLGCQLQPSLPYTLRTRARGNQGPCDHRHLQGPDTTC